MRISDWSSDVCSSDLKPGGKTLEDWIDNCPNADYAALTYQGGAAWRARLMADIGGKPNVKKLLDGFDDEALAALMTNLGGHCIETLIEAFDSAGRSEEHTSELQSPMRNSYAVFCMQK